MFCQSLNCVSSPYKPHNSDTLFGKSKQLVISVNVSSASLALVFLSGPYAALSCACLETLSVHTADTAEAEADLCATPVMLITQLFWSVHRSNSWLRRENVQTFCNSFHRLIKSLHNITVGKK